MKKLLSVFVVAILALAGCGATGADSSNVATEITEPVTVQFWHPFTGEIEKSLQTLTDKFNAENDNITIELTNQGQYNDLYTKIKSAGSSDSLPTMAIAYSTWEDAYEYVDNLEGYEGIDNTELKFDNIVDAYLDEVKGTEGGIYGVPYNKSTEVVYYNKDLFKEAGITEAPKTLEDLFADAKIVTDKTGVTGIGFDSLSNYLGTSMNSNDLSEWRDKDNNFQFDNEKIQADVKMYQDGIKDGYARTAGEDGFLSGPFGSEQVAAYVGSTAGASFVDSGVNGKFEWGSVPLPTNKVIEQGANIVVFKSAKPEEKLAAWKYIDYLLQDENVVSFATETGYLPVTKSALETEDYQKVLADNEVAKAAADSTDRFQTIVPKFNGANEIYQDKFKSIMNEILDGKEDVATKLSELNEMAKSVYDLNNM